MFFLVLWEFKQPSHFHKWYHKFKKNKKTKQIQFNYFLFIVAIQYTSIKTFCIHFVLQYTIIILYTNQLKNII